MCYVVLAAVLLTGCAVIDSFGGDDDNIRFPPDDARTSDGPDTTGSCAFVFDLGNVSRTSGTGMNSIDTCGGESDLDFAETCGSNNPNGEGLVLSVTASVAEQYMICINPPTEASLITGVVQQCQLTPNGLCDIVDGNSITCFFNFLDAGKNFLYYQPNNNSCGLATFEINGDMLMLEDGS